MVAKAQPKPRVKPEKQHAPKRALVLMSGGLKSFLAALIYKKAEYQVYGLYLNYGQGSSIQERTYLDKQAGLVGFKKLIYPGCTSFASSGALPNYDIDDYAILYKETIKAINDLISAYGRVAMDAIHATVLVAGSTDIPGAKMPVEMKGKTNEELLALLKELSPEIHVVWSCRHKGYRPCGKCDKCKEWALQATL